MTHPTTGSGLEHEIGPDGLVSISLPSGEIRLRAVDGGTVRIRDRDGSDLDAMFTIDRSEGSVALTAGRDGGRGGRGRHGHAPDLDVDVPSAATILIETASVDIEADGLLGDQRYRTTSGDIALRGVAGRIDIEAVSGDVDIVATAEADVAIRTVSGDLELRAGTLRSLVVATTSGDLKIAGRLAGPGPFGVESVSGDGLFAPAGDLRIEMTTMSGDLQSEVDARAEGGRGRRTLSIGTGGPLLTFRSMSGDLRIVRPTPVAAPPTRTVAGPVTDTVRHDDRPSGTEPAPETNGAIALAYDDARLRILRSLERGEIDVTEAGRRLEALDDADPNGAGASPAPDPDAPTDG